MSLARGRGDLNGEVHISKKIDKQIIRNILEQDHKLSLSLKREEIIENELLKLEEPVTYRFIRSNQKKIPSWSEHSNAALVRVYSLQS